MSLAPIALFVFDRPDHAKRTVEALQKNLLAGESELFIYSDAARNSDEAEVVEKVRSYIKTISGFRTITTVERKKNWGLANSIIDGVSKIVKEYGKVVVVEDDLITSPYFLTYMNEGLDRYENDDRVISIHGYVYPVQQNLPEAFFLPGADCWGWATWARGWKLFNEDGAYLLSELKKRKLSKVFNYNDSYPYTRMLRAQILEDNDSWAIRWYASAFLEGKLTLYPGRSLVHNIGNDSSGTHSPDASAMDTELSDRPINLDSVVVSSSIEARAAFEAFFMREQGGPVGRVLAFLKAVARSKK